MLKGMSQKKPMAGMSKKKFEMPKRLALPVVHNPFGKYIEIIREDIKSIWNDILNRERKKKEDAMEYKDFMEEHFGGMK